MRTTLTLDEDVARKLQEAVHQLRRPFRQVVNEFLRLGLQARHTTRKAKPFRVRAKRMGQRVGRSYDSIPQLLDAIEDPDQP